MLFLLIQLMVVVASYGLLVVGRRSLVVVVVVAVGIKCCKQGGVQFLGFSTVFEKAKFKKMTKPKTKNERKYSGLETYDRKFARHISLKIFSQDCIFAFLHEPPPSSIFFNLRTWTPYFAADIRHHTAVL